MEKLPNLEKPKRNSPSDRLSQTINHDRFPSNHQYVNLNLRQKPFNTIDVQSYESGYQVKNDFATKKVSPDSVQLSENKFNSA